MDELAKTLRPMIKDALERGGVEAIVEVVCETFSALEARVVEFQARITELERQLNKNSTNSSKPPSSDGLHRNCKTSLRTKHSGRKPGGQAGHIGHTLHASDHPDIITHLPLSTCPDCKGDLSHQVLHSYEKRQVFDLPEIKMQVTEWRAEHKRCPHCSKLVSAAFPSGTTAPVQYGPRAQASMCYLNVRQVIPCARVSEIFQDCFGHRPSPGSVVQAVVRCADLIKPQVNDIANTLRQAPLLHADETGARCMGKTHWLHVASTATHSHFSYSPKRGKEGMAAADILPNFTGYLMHDFWKSYDHIGCQHSRCNAHLLRELTAFSEEEQRWAKQVIATLLAMKKAVEEARENGQKSVAEEHRKRLGTLYEKWIKAGLKLHPEAAQTHGKRGRKKQSKERNLLIRLRDKREEVLRFFHELGVPFDNNQAERDLRMIKVQQKVSGCFRSEKGAERFCVMSSYISTMRKQKQNVIESLCSAFLENPSISVT
jgi:transposase